MPDSPPGLPSARAVQAGVRSARVHARRASGEPAEHLDSVAVEEPLEIRVQGDALATTMRTPGQDQELVAGFLLSEGLIRERGDLGSIAHCGRPDDPGAFNVIDVTPAPGVRWGDALEHSRRGTLTTAACGVCGRRSIDDLLSEVEPLTDTARFTAELLASLSERLPLAQPNFARTGGLHAAGITDGTGEYRVVREDIGRHNATDKAVGRLLLDGALPAAGCILVVSGRASFEIVVKALRAGIPCVLSVSAPSSLAIDTATRAGITLVGFARGTSFNAYSRAERIDW